MRGDIILSLLTVVKDIAGSSSDVLNAFLSAGYGASMGRLQYLADVNRRERERAATRRELKEREYQKFHNLLSYARRNRLVIEEERGGRNILRLTRRGIAKLFALEEKKKNALPSRNHVSEKGDTHIIIIFDIPEGEKRKREWLRAALRSLGFSMIQKSVWSGMVKLPKSFLEDLRTLELLDYVEILQAYKLGSLEWHNKR